MPLTDVFLDSRNVAGGRDGSSGAPYNSWAELPTPNTPVGGNRYNVVRGSRFNTQACILSTTQSSPIEIVAYGPESDPAPIMECYALAQASDCTEVALTQTSGASGTASGATTDTAGYSIGATTINLAAVGSGTITTDGGVTFAGDSNVYAISSGTGNVNGGSITLYAPGLKAAISGAVAVTRVSGAIAREQAGTNLWAVRKLIGCFGDGAGTVWWGRQWDIGNVIAGGWGAVTPSADYELGYGTVNGGLFKILYSVGNPTTYYSGDEIYIAGVAEADYIAASYKQGTFGAFQCGAGYLIDGIEFGISMDAVRFATGNGYSAYPQLQNNRVTNCVIRNTYRGITYQGVTPTESTPSVGPNRGIGYTGIRVTGNLIENVGNIAIHPTSGGGLRNDTIIEDNVISGFGLSLSTAGIYVGSACWTNDGTVIRVQWNSISGGRAGNVNKNEGYGLYCEAGDFTGTYRLPTQSVWMTRNYVWDCDLTANINKPGPNICMGWNVFIARETNEIATNQKAISGTEDDYSGYPGSVTIVGNVAVGYARFLFGATIGSIGAVIWRVRRNVAMSSGDIPGCTAEALNVGSHDETRIQASENNLFGFSMLWKHSTGTEYGVPPQMTDPITTDPSAEVARLPVPVDTVEGRRVNYARQCCVAPIRGGVVDLTWG